MTVRNDRSSESIDWSRLATIEGIARLRRISYGLILVLLDSSVALPTVGLELSLVPDWCGWWVTLRALRDLRAVHPDLATLLALARALLVCSLPLWLVPLEGRGDPGLVAVRTGIEGVSLLLSLLFAWSLCGFVSLVAERMRAPAGPTPKRSPADRVHRQARNCRWVLLLAVVLHLVARGAGVSLTELPRRPGGLELLLATLPGGLGIYGVLSLLLLTWGAGNLVQAVVAGRIHRRGREAAPPEERG